MKDYLPETASQTAGPYVHIGLAPDAAGFHIFEKNFGPTLVNSHTPGERIAIEGRVFDGSGTPVRDVLIEIWQANAEGATTTPPIGRKANHWTLIFVAGVVPALTLIRASGALTPLSPDRRLAAMGA